MYSDSVKPHLIGNLSNSVVLDSLACDVCKCHLMIVHMMVNIRLPHTLTASNRSLSSLTVTRSLLAARLSGALSLHVCTCTLK